jgi:hypothetical protein
MMFGEVPSQQHLAGCTSTANALDIGYLRQMSMYSDGHLLYPCSADPSCCMLLLCPVPVVTMVTSTGDILRQ